MVKAVAVLRGDSSSVTGTVTFTQSSQTDQTTIEAQLENMTPGKHGFHIHEFGDNTNGCTSAGPHYNPDNVNHGGPDDEVRHAGDFGNVVAGKDGKVNFKLTDKKATLFGPTSIIGRTIVVHAGEDDLGKGGQELSLTTGNSGDRVACGVVGLAQVK
ncbi:superoxide dismutase [Radiomyces spectabilis]|uniref:superoxide dismutase n=1 Tax=Radiomyces spectabilis TaxID=64574 RepID=UPI0022208AE0|nr:superoxide dismutase [Radiomyces spectabilis]KAI8388054.1 superoxide dismutase [Radiomyces spectabilis]